MIFLEINKKKDVQIFFVKFKTFYNLKFIFIYSFVLIFFTNMRQMISLFLIKYSYFLKALIIAKKLADSRYLSRFITFHKIYTKINKSLR